MASNAMPPCHQTPEPSQTPAAATATPAAVKVAAMPKTKADE